MPWFIDGKNCVIAGTKDAPGETVKCHDSNDAALRHLKALYANMPEYEKELGGIINFTEGAENRCLIICTADETDRDGEIFGVEAMDYAFAHAKESGMPQLRGIHIKGLHIGDVVDLFRAGKYGVAVGQYFNTPIAQEFRAAVDRGTMKGSSLGFSPVEITGRCPQCGARLLAGRFALRVGFMCPACSGIYSGRALKEVRFQKAEIFDVTLTERPSVRSTNVVNFTLKETIIMDRQTIKERLIKAGFDEGVVTHYVDALSDEDCQRMKDDVVEQTFKDVLAASATTVDTDPPAPATATGILDLDKVLTVIKEEIVKAMPTEIEIELPVIDAKLKELEGKLDQIVTYLKEAAKADETRLKEMAVQASPATRSRLMFRQSSEVTNTTKEAPPAPGSVVIPDASGRQYATVTEFLTKRGGAQ